MPWNLPWNSDLTNVRNVLAGLYSTREDSYRVVDSAGLPRMHVAFSDKAINNWHSILTEAAQRGKVLAVIEAALQEYPDNSWLRHARQQGDLPIRGPVFGEDRVWEEPSDLSLLEKIIGAQSTLLPINFLEVGLVRARSVARIVCPDCLGTGFLIDNNLLITNHHVLENETSARQAVVQFNYQKTLSGQDAKYEEFALTPEKGFATSPLQDGDDWTAVRVRGNPNNKWGALTLTRVRVQKRDRVNIIQHPSGGPKQISLYHNLVSFANDQRIQYLTDTLPGSSGSPVFDNDWRVVALHHSGGWLNEPGSKKTHYRNEGIHINNIIDGITKATKAGCLSP